MVAMTTNKPARFAIVGVANTIVDFSIFTTLVMLGLNNVIANYPSATIAMLFSFFANKQFTFGGKDKASLRQLMLFAAITLVGLWVMQPIIIYMVGGQLLYWYNNTLFVSLAAKLCAVAITLLWNYSMYKRFVFNK